MRKIPGERLLTNVLDLEFLGVIACGRAKKGLCRERS